ncbi:MAG: four helix bundle protein [Candidatus Yanofskybacteria bacterium RIFCSPHIGHO2_01_FULL_43_42]|uniref:Four helix bundle protein n=1 Tax=Candidatus Yanofskybacteria bacterium RIFCSPLOWO2_01_FULL_43_22 TaxID=1802695 RepID=A0A1F8GGW5_9BACT|nr:MAG: four helix bundle protein [Candidatus Yanofskybacteria bacterium RIFCSPHIGHO2_01_FULL_43_42]OGN12542.1 MAG: four helix bundle protein [Candidatus Yanofskybacteria bacterium RIFCSPHIGHO2_02_FULL_43_17]OGN23689.1 MAG: four helix bundle protein [Candidatus Yanofskybacteria bacterium RIFCSPLOWO2_01_FULL_43_22]
MEQETGKKLGYRSLIVWEKAHELAIKTYQATKTFPKDELFGLVSQMRRCAVSVPANVVEGYSRRSVKEKLNFYNIANGSLSELEYYIDLAFELKYVDEEIHNNLIVARADVGRLLNGFIKSFK